MGILSRLMHRADKDPYWEAFINRPASDSAKTLTHAIRNAPEGRVFPVKSEVPEPTRMAQDLAELAHFLGASSMGVAAMDAAYLRLGESDDKQDAPKNLVADHPFVVMCAVHAEYDPDVHKGMGGQFAVQESVSVNFSVSAYIRELGYRATVRPVDSLAVAVAAGLGTRGKDAHLVTKEHGSHVYLGDGVLTDLPLALGKPGR